MTEDLLGAILMGCGGGGGGLILAGLSTPCAKLPKPETAPGSDPCPTLQSADRSAGCCRRLPTPCG